MARVKEGSGGSKRRAAAYRKVRRSGEILYALLYVLVAVLLMKSTCGELQAKESEQSTGMIVDGAT